MEIPKPFKMPVRVTESNKEAYLDIRRVIKENQLIRMIIQAALDGKAMIMYPYFTNHFQSLGSLQKAKLIDYNFVKNTYVFGEKLKIKKK